MPDFPVDVLPTVVAEMVTAVATFTQTDLAMAGGVALATMAACSGGRVEVEVRPGWSEPTNLYAVVIASPAERKSAVHARMTRPLFDAEQVLVQAARPQVIEAEVEKDVAKRAADRARAVAGASDGDRRALTADAVAAAAMAEEIAVPILPRLVVDDVTPEALVSLLAEQRGRLAVLSAEAGVFDAIAGRYSSVPNLDAWLKGHAGDPLRIDRRGRPPEFVDRPALTVSVMVQPSVISTLGRNDAFRGRGLLARFVYIAPPSLVGRRKANPEPIADDLGERYDTAVRDLAVAMGRWDATVTVPLAADALARLLSFADQVEPMLGPGGSLAHIADWAGKLVGAVARIAGAIHAFEVGPQNFHQVSDPISAETIERAIVIGRFMTQHAVVVFSAMSADPRMADARHVLSVLSRHIDLTVTKRDLFAKVGRGRFAKAGDLDPVLDLLVDYGWLARLPSEERNGPGRPPSPRFAMHPHLAHFVDSANSADGMWTQ